MMDHPTCRTCPYWDPIGPDPEDVVPEGWCHRFPGPPAVTRVMIEETGMYDMIIPVSSATHWCGEHPSFPAYLASLKEKP